MGLIVDLDKNISNEDIDQYLKESMNQKGWIDNFFIKFSLKTFLKSAAYTKEDFTKLFENSQLKVDIIKEDISLYVYFKK